MFTSLNLLFGGVLVAVVVGVCLSSLLTGVMGWSVNTRDMTDTRVAIAADAYSKSAKAERIIFFLWMMLISFLKTNVTFCPLQ